MKQGSVITLTNAIEQGHYEVAKWLINETNIEDDLYAISMAQS